MKIFLASGERSGDLHGAGLALALRQSLPGVELIGVGGREMEAAGVRLAADYEVLAVVGIAEVLPRLPEVFRLLRRLRKLLREERPDLYVAIDAPDFNFRLMTHAARAGIPVVYFIVPQFWAWRRGRLRAMKRWVDLALPIFPFEVPLLKEAGVPARFVGHPMAEQHSPTDDRRQAKERLGFDGAHPLVAVLPGSRVSEWRRHVPALTETVRWVDGARAGIQWAWSVAPSLRDQPRPAFSGENATPRTGGPAERVLFHEGPASDLLAAGDVCLVASGTATVEAALLDAPTIVFYRVAPVTSALARLFVKVPHFAMVNLLADERLVPEYFQSDVRADRLGPEILRLLDDPSLARRQREGFRRVRGLLSSPGAYARAAGEILDVARRAGREPRRA